MTRPVHRPTTSPTTYPRLLHVDNLRTALTALVVTHHAALGYSNIPGWYYVEPPTDSSATLLDVLLLLNQAFFMGAFFLISALFVPGSYDRKGPRASSGNGCCAWESRCCSGCWCFVPW
jgi:glucans biosynthesis protein C